MRRVYLFGMSEFIVAFNMKELLEEEKAVTLFDDSGEEKGTLYYVTFWFNSIGWNAPGSPLVLVGTHKDQLTQLEIQRVNAIIGRHIESLEVYQSLEKGRKRLNLHTPKQCELGHVVCFLLRLIQRLISDHRSCLFLDYTFCKIY